MEKIGFVTRIEYAPLESIIVMPVKEEELEILKQGRKNSIYITISTALFSSALSLTVIFISGFDGHEDWFKIFLSTVIVCFTIMGVILLLVRRAGKDLFNETVEKIEARKAKLEFMGLDPKENQLLERFFEEENKT